MINEITNNTQSQNNKYFTPKIHNLGIQRGLSKVMSNVKNSILNMPITLLINNKKQKANLNSKERERLKTRVL